MGAVYDSGDYEKALDAALKAANWNGAQGRARQGAQAKAGWSASAWRCTSRSAASVRRRRCRPAAGSTAQVTIERDGRITRDDRRLAARPGQRDDVRADARRSVQRAVRARHDPARRHRHREAGHRHVRQPLAGGRRHRAAHGRRQGEDEDGEVRRGAARSAAKTTSSSRTARSA